ncbi:Gfo/Idh/MocA family protein [Streptomyces sp. AC550_RSS872]|uniref:Gfo/Idh/MocA family protein n=1 Tax=Streptomyces sp. AC550_RSS872 TaxID=2823689 RepID=UPI001C2769A6|nr:Gfo/Idh/MocA family oxidoreductase [Streptomyces sp. AC550_RSS872]
MTSPVGHNRPVRFGVIGCADIAWRRTLPAMVAEETVGLVAVASRQSVKAERFADRFGCVPVEGYEALLARDDIDAVYVPLPAMLHADWVGRALAAGKHVFAEKPLTTEEHRTRQLVALARARGLVLLENFMFLHHSQHAAVDELVAGGAIGEMRGFSSAFTIPPKPADDIRNSAETGGGALVDIGVYPIRAAMRFLGPDLELGGAVLRIDRERDIAVSGSVQLFRPDDGVTAQLNFGMEHSYRTSYELSGSRGRLSLDRVFTPPESYQPVLRLERQDHREERTLPADDQFRNVVRDFARAVRTGDRLDGLAECSLRNAALVEQVRDHAQRVYV